MWLVWIACAPIQAPPTSSAELMHLLAGPRAEEEGASRGSGPLPVYTDDLRETVSPRITDCAEDSPSPRASAWVVATIARDGALLDLQLRRSSGSSRFDTCVVDAFRGVDLPAPPGELVEQGRLVTPKLSFP